MDENKATSLDDFENQLKQNINDGASSLSDFENQLKQNMNGVDQTTSPMGQAGQVNPNKQTIKVQKNIVLSFPSDFTGCGHIRNIFPMNYLTNLYGKQGSLLCMIAPFYIRQVDVLARSRSLFFQRQMNEPQFKIVQNYKNLQKDLKYKMVWDLDDNILGLNEKQGGDKDSGVPSYNFGYRNIDDGVRKFAPKIADLMDTCCFSTEYLKNIFVNAGIQSNCVVVPNSVPKFFWGGIKRPDKKQRIEKPRVLITSSPTHYSNHEKKKGDFDNAWLPWLIDSVKKDRIKLTVMGGLPFFLEKIKRKIKVINWVSSFDYHTYVKNQRADIIIGPLVCNEFNRAKSDIKYVEACACSAPFIGTVFNGDDNPSPYDNCLLKVNEHCTVDDIEEIVEKLRDPVFHNKIKNEQFDMLDREGRWTESKQYIEKWLSII